jgi:hypothetical protein
VTSDNFSSDIHNYGSKPAPTGVPSLKRYGTAGMGIDLSPEAWPAMQQVFSSDSKDHSKDLPGRPQCTHVPGVMRLPLNVLDTHPVDLLLLGELEQSSHAAWMERVAHATEAPSLLFEFWEDRAVLLPEDPMSKQVVTKWEELKYNSTCIRLNATQVGGVVDRPTSTRKNGRGLGR